MTLDGRILDCNKTYAKKLGYSKEEILGKSIFFHTADQKYRMKCRML
ncbi:PAS domain-containing protein [Candidatus Nitrosotalea sp. TS]